MVSVGHGMVLTGANADFCSICDSPPCFDKEDDVGEYSESQAAMKLCGVRKKRRGDLEEGEVEEVKCRKEGRVGVEEEDNARSGRRR